MCQRYNVIVEDCQAVWSIYYVVRCIVCVCHYIFHLIRISKSTINNVTHKKKWEREWRWRESTKSQKKNPTKHTSIYSVCIPHGMDMCSTDENFSLWTATTTIHWTGKTTKATKAISATLPYSLGINNTALYFIFMSNKIYFATDVTNKFFAHDCDEDILSVFCLLVRHLHRRYIKINFFKIRPSARMHPHKNNLQPNHHQLFFFFLLEHIIFDMIWDTCHPAFENRFQLYHSQKMIKRIEGRRFLVEK